jgi:purine catabolism regulator
VAQIAGARESLRDAELALSHAAGERGRRVVAFEQLDLGTLLLSEAAPERLAPKVQALLATLRAHPPLHEALVTYFDHDLDSAAAAAALHLHPNSLRYRLARVEKLLGCSLKHPATIAELHIALLAARAGFTKPRTRPHSS